MDIFNYQQRELGAWQQQLLAVALLESLAINYNLFAELTTAGNAKVFGNILDLAWEQLAGHNSKVDWLKQREKLEAITPDPEQFEGFGVWPALDACSALAELIAMLDDRDSAELDSIVRVYVAGISQYLAATEQAEEDSHPLYQQAREWMDAAIELVESPGLDKAQRCQRVKQHARDYGLSNIGLEKP